MQKQGVQLAGIQILGFGVFREGCQGGKWQQDTLLPFCFLSWAILMIPLITHLTRPQCPHRPHTGWDEAYATLPKPAKEQSRLWLVSWCFSSSAQTLCPLRPEAFCTRDAIIFYPLASRRTAQATANGTIPKGLFFFFWQIKQKNRIQDI